MQGHLRFEDGRRTYLDSKDCGNASDMFDILCNSADFPFL